MGLIQEIFPGYLQEKYRCLEHHMNMIRELRIRIQSPVIVCMDNKENYVTREGNLSADDKDSILLKEKDIENIILHICHSSLYAYEEELKRGYLTIPGGHRVGVAGQVVLNDKGQIKTMKNIFYLNIRVAHEVTGNAERLLPYVYSKDRIRNTLIISPPGFGKTTLLRDLVRHVSDGTIYGWGRRCSIVDERSELAGSYRGIPQLNIGMRSDVLDGCPKAIGMMMMIRSMGPEVIAVDELGTEEDIKALFAVVRSGCGILATIHGDNLKTLQNKSFLKQMIDEKVFERYVVIRDKHHVLDIYDGDMNKC